MRRFFVVFVGLLIPLAAFLTYSPDLDGLLALNQDPDMGAHWGIRVRSGDDVTAYMDSAGFSAVRIGFRWQLIEKDGDAPDTANFNPDAQYIKDQVQAARAEGMTPVALLDGKPVWIEDCGAGHPDNDENALFAQGACVPRDSGGEWDEYREFITYIHSEFDSIVDHWELWNEAGSDGWQTGHRRGLLFNRPPRALDSIAKIAGGTLSGSGETIICCGFKDEGTIYDFTKNDSVGAVDDKIDQDWIATFASRWSDRIDVISVHHYDSVGGAFIERETDEIVSDLDAVGAPQTVWLTEFGIGCRNLQDEAWEIACSDDTVRIHTDPSDAAAVIRGVQSAQAEESDWKRSFYFLYQRNNDHRVGLFTSGSDPVQVDSIREEVHCAFVSTAGNEGDDGECPNVYDITGHGIGQKVPPLTDCHFLESTTSGTTPYSWEWYQRGCEDCPEGYSGSGSSVTVSTPSSGSFILKVIVTDDNGARDVYEEIYTVESGAMCQT